MVVVLSGFGCGGSSENGADGDFCGATPCGGDLVGIWKDTAACSSLTPPTACPGATIQDLSVTHTTYTFGAETSTGAGPYTVTGSQSGSVTTTYLTSCLTGSSTCASFDEQMRSLASTVPSIYASYTCSPSAAGCDCTATFNPAPLTATGSYSHSSSDLVLSLGGSLTPDQYSYCVRGNLLHLKGTGAVNAIVDSVFVKQ